jgi:hypothetical protein
VVPVEYRVEHVERQPAEGEGSYDGRQHSIDPLGSSGIPDPLHHVPGWEKQRNELGGGHRNGLDG